MTGDRNTRRRVGLGVAAALAFMALDQASKWWMLDVLRIAERPPIELTPFFSLVMVWNHGISFGMFGGAQASPWIFVGISTAIAALLLRWLLHERSALNASAIGMVIGGAAGNVIDRIRFGAVADFFDAHVAGYHWPAFNIADSAICIGVVLLCWRGMFRPVE